MNINLILLISPNESEVKKVGNLLINFYYKKISDQEYILAYHDDKEDKESVISSLERVKLNKLKDIIDEVKEFIIETKKNEGDIDLQDEPRNGEIDVVFEEIIVGAHFKGGMSYSEAVEKQKEIMEKLEKEGLALKFSYYTTSDVGNSFITGNPEYNNYYTEAFTEGKFDKLIAVLRARAKREEINLLDAKKKLYEFVNAFLPIAVDCIGIDELERMHRDTSEYKKEAFGKGDSKAGDFKDFFEDFWITQNIEDKCKSLKDSLELKKVDINQIERSINNLKSCSECGVFVERYKTLIQRIGLLNLK